MRSLKCTLYLLIVLLSFAGCGSHSSNDRSPFPDYGLQQGDIITIEISSPNLFPVEGKIWVTSSVTLPHPMWDHASTIWNGYLYVAGGSSSCDNNYQGCGFTDKAYYAPISPEGTIGSFRTTTPLPRTLRGHSMLAYNDYMYLIGGIVQPQFGEPPYPDPTASETILNEKAYFAHINPDGSLSGWIETTPLPPPAEGVPADKAGLFALSATVHNINGTGYIYVTGGWNVELKKNVKTLLIGPISSDGSIAAWLHNPTSDLPYDLSKHTSVAADINGENYLYIIGGNSGSIGNTGGTQTFHRGIYYAPLSTDGIPHDWKQASASLPLQLIDHATVTFDRYIVVLGGRDGDDNVGKYNPNPNVYYYFITDTGDLELLPYRLMLPEPLFHHASVADKNTTNIYVTGGAGGDTDKKENRRDSVYFLTNPNP